MKKNISILLVLCFVFSLCACESKGSKKLKENPATDFELDIGEDDVVIKKYIGKSKTVVIPEKIEGKPVIMIAVCAFMNQDVEKVVIPSAVTVIWDYAFANCTSLKEVVFGDGVTRIMREAFSNCSSLTELDLPKNLEIIETHAFENCSSLKKVFIPKSLTRMYTEVFSDCPIEQITLEDGIKTFGSYASFWGAKVKEITIPASVEKIGEYTFHDNLKKVTFLGDAPKEIGKQPFGTKATIYYKKGTKGWEETSLKEEYKLIAQY